MVHSPAPLSPLLAARCVAPHLQLSDLFSGWQVANEIMKPKVSIKYQQLTTKTAPEMEICNRK